MDNSLVNIDDINDINDIKLYDKVHESTNSKIYKGLYKDRKILCKLLEKKATEKISIKNEIDIVLMLEKHPNIIDVLYTIEYKDSYMIVMDYSGRHNLSTHPKSECFDINTRYNISCKIMEGLEYLHTNLIAHLDIKPQNIVIDERLNPRICDFGFSIKAESKFFECSLRKGTPLYVAPEIVMSQYGNPFYADIYSLGILLWQIYAREVPYKEIKCESDRDIEDFLYEVCFFNKRPDIKKVPKILSDIITSAWDLEPSKRPSIKKIKILFDLARLDILSLKNN